MAAIRVSDAAAEKGCTHRAITSAVRRGDLNAILNSKIAGAIIGIIVDDTYSAWQPDPKQQAAGRGEITVQRG